MAKEYSGRESPVHLSLSPNAAVGIFVVIELEKVEEAELLLQLNAKPNYDLFEVGGIWVLFILIFDDTHLNPRSPQLILLLLLSSSLPPRHQWLYTSSFQYCKR